jgi:hypothetical protein
MVCGRTNSSMDPTTAAKEGRERPAGAWLTSAPRIMVRCDERNCGDTKEAEKGEAGEDDGWLDMNYGVVSGPKCGEVWCSERVRAA